MIINNKTTHPLIYLMKPEAPGKKAKDAKDGEQVKPEVVTPGTLNIQFMEQFKATSVLGRTVFVFPGITGNHPKELADLASFKSHVASELCKVIDEKQEPEASRVRMSPMDVVKLPDFDVVKHLKTIDEKAAAKLIFEIVKMPTLDEIERTDKRSEIIQAIERQKKNIAASIQK